MIDEKIYTGWAFTENEMEKMDINMKIYLRDLKTKQKLFKASEPTEEELNQLTCYRYIGNGHKSQKYEILSNPHNLSILELALICDEGNLCFGYRVENKQFIIYVD